MFLGIGIGYALRNWSILQKTEKTISLTIFLLLFILGVSIGSNSLIVNNLGKFGWQAIILSTSGVLGSLIAARLVLGVSPTFTTNVTLRLYFHRNIHKLNL